MIWYRISILGRIKISRIKMYTDLSKQVNLGDVSQFNFYKSLLWNTLIDPCRPWFQRPTYCQKLLRPWSIGIILHFCTFTSSKKSLSKSSQITTTKSANFISVLCAPVCDSSQRPWWRLINHFFIFQFTISQMSHLTEQYDIQRRRIP